MSSASVEQRLTVLEEELAAIKETLASTGQERPWWRRIVGVYQDDSTFEESARLGREWRESFGPNGDDPAPL
jgi:hypothetical protein